MGARKQIILMVMVMFAVSILVGVLTSFSLYRTAFEEVRLRLLEQAQSQGHLMEAVARYDMEHSPDYPGGAGEATLSQIREAHASYEAMGETGEFTLARRSGDQIQFLLRHRYSELIEPSPVPFNSALAEPMRRALSGEAGSMIGLDYRGETVLAAYEPVAVLNLGVVSKIDLIEIRAPFVRSLATSLALGLLLTTLGGVLLARLGDPLVTGLRESEARYRAVVEDQTELIRRHLPDTTLTFVNEAFCRFFGRRRDELVGQKFVPLMPEADQLKVQEQITSLGEDKPVATDEHRVFVNGETRWLSWTNRAVLNDAGYVVEFQGTGRDITERKQAEEQMEAHLRQRQKLEAIGTLAGVVAHEINNPITGIMNYAQLIDDRLDPESPLREYAGEIGRETDRVAGIVQSLLAFARQERESHSPATIADIVNDTVSLIRTIIRRDQITLNVEVSTDLPKVKCRSQQIQQVLMNLLINARDALNERYSGHDPEKIMTVTVRLFEKEGRPWIRSTVEDQGVGIPDEARDRVFEPFFTTKDRSHGTGLGLSISREIVTEHHGELFFECGDGRHTSFHFDLPVDDGWFRGDEPEESKGAA